MPSFSRREFLLKSSTFLSTSLLCELFPTLGFADPFYWSEKTPDHFFVLVRTFGGMDATMGLDPQLLPPGCDDKDLFIEHRPEDIATVGGIKLGPAAHALIPHAKDCLVINGVMMRRDAGHDALSDYILTGRGDGKAASLPAELSLSHGTGPFGVICSRTTFVSDKSIILTGTEEFLTPSNEEEVLALLEEKLELEGDGTPLEEAQKALLAARPIAIKLTAILAALKEKFGTLNAQHALAACLASGAAWEGQLDNNSGNLDTHTNHPKNHYDSQKRDWEYMASLFSVFKAVPYLSGSLFDYTTFLTVSEFSRTPFLNAAKGKDHNALTNSLLLAGKGIKKGTTVGGSLLLPRKTNPRGFAEHMAHPFDYRTQTLAKTKAGASFIFPENIARTIGALFGDPKGFAPVPLTIPVITAVKA